MNTKTVETYLKIAPNNSMITIVNRAGKLEKFIKENIVYTFNKDKTLIISDKTEKAIFIFNINHIIELKINYNKFEPMCLFDGAKTGENKILV